MKHEFANLWATETMGNAKYPLELFLRVVTVSMETMKVVGLEILNASLRVDNPRAVDYAVTA